MVDKKDIDKFEEDIEKRFGVREFLKWFTLWGFLYGPIDERLHIRDALEKALKREIPPHVNWLFCFGGITFVIFVIQVITGTLLLFYYHPTVSEAYKSVQFINNHVPFGWLMRSVHRWGSNLIIITIFIHMVRVFYYGAYKPPRDFNWVIGVILFITVLSFSFTGNLLPWTQSAYWSTFVGTDIIEDIPVVGGFLKLFLRGGEEVTTFTLSRFFVFHILILPFFITFLLALHFSMIRRLGISDPL
jgi:quinol-cytochrome oxidoreductase complex cytochrome b subunit